jgi:hypothetical protein
LTGLGDEEPSLEAMPTILREDLKTEASYIRDTCKHFTVANSGPVPFEYLDQRQPANTKERYKPDQEASCPCSERARRRHQRLTGTTMSWMSDAADVVLNGQVLPFVFAAEDLIDVAESNLNRVLIE